MTDGIQSAVWANGQPERVGELLAAVQNTYLLHLFDNVGAADLLIVVINHPAREILSRSE